MPSSFVRYYCLSGYHTGKQGHKTILEPLWMELIQGPGYKVPWRMGRKHITIVAAMKHFRDDDQTVFNFKSVVLFKILFFFCFFFFFVFFFFVVLFFIQNQ